MDSEVITRNDLATILNEILPHTEIDYIVEQGTDGIWTYRKWNSGIAECWGRYTESAVTIPKAATKHLDVPNFPFTFASTPVPSVSCAGIGWTEMGVTYTAADVSVLDAYARNFNSLTDFSGDLIAQIYVIGRWK